MRKNGIGIKKKNINKKRTFSLIKQCVFKYTKEKSLSSFIISSIFCFTVCTNVDGIERISLISISTNIALSIVHASYKISWECEKWPLEIVSKTLLMDTGWINYDIFYFNL